MIGLPSEINHFQKPLAPADNTRVNMPPVLVQKQTANPAQINNQLNNIYHDVAGNARPNQTYLSAAPKLTPQERERQNKLMKEYETRQKLQKNLNAICSADPFAARVNGYYNFGTGNKSNWQKIGPGPLETAGYITATTMPLTSAALAGLAVKEAVQDPSAYNIGSAGLSVLGVAPLARMAKPLGTAMKVEQNLNRIQKVSGNVDRVNTGINIFKPEDK